MVFQLLDEDEQTFMEVLALLDDYNAAFEDPVPPHSCTKHSSPFSRFTESAAWAAFESAHPITKTASKHRNGAREMRRREVQFLRTCAKGLETQLKALKEAVEHRAQTRKSTPGAGEPSVLTSMWKDLATHQLDQRLVSERENSRLKAALDDQNKVREMLHRALNTRVAKRVMETSLTQEKRTRRVLGVPLEIADQEIFEELEVGVDSVYHEAARVFFQADTSLGEFGEKTLPFNLHRTAEAAWRCLARAFQHEKYHFSYSRERRKNDSTEVAYDDTVGESFGVEIKAPERMAEFRIKQVFRRYVESDRIIIAWRSYIDPAEFKGQKLHGFRFQEKGSCVIGHSTKLYTPDNDLSMLRIWHVITPENLASSDRSNSEFVQDLTEFVLGGSSSANTVQMIENSLLDAPFSQSCNDFGNEELV
ncbi:M96 mating-specific protein [Phytophthora megakarya]|uniref:M96 mating-specific protein n=1 Tax=Phytophthora megakarya TaxID=4795 RepID=A0A225VL78_9STRA|nr:M96 mating-specific protein [Phytophthora megakarya]